MVIDLGMLGIWGGGGLGREVLELAQIINERELRWEKFIFIVDKMDIPPVVNDVHVITYQEFLKSGIEDIEFIIGVGEPAIRERIFQNLCEANRSFATLIHPEVHIPKTTEIGRGTVISTGSFISCNVKIGDNVYIQPHVNIGHDCVLENGCMVSGFGNIAGACKIGEYSYIGMNSCIREGISIGNYSILGMYSAAYKDIPDEMVAVGNPARPMRRNTERRVFK